MVLQTKTKIPENFEAILIMVPLWDNSVWEPLQKQEYKKAMDRFYSLLGYYTRSTIRKIAWKKILEGDEKVRGVLSLNEWRLNILPYFGSIILNISDKDFFEYIYSILEVETLFFFHAGLISQIPGETATEKLEYATGKREWLGNFFLGSPLGVLFNGFLLEKSNVVTKLDLTEVMDRINILPDGLRSPFFSSFFATSIKNFCVSYGLNKQETTDLAYLIGGALLGIVTKNEFQNETEKISKERVGEKIETFSNEAYQNFIFPYEEEIQTLKDSIESIITETEKTLAIQEEEPEKEAVVKINKVSFPKAEAPELPKRDENAPLILHKEDVDRLIPPGEKTSVFSKGFSSFGFFKKKETKPTVSAVPTQAPISKTPSEIKIIKPTAETKLVKTSPSIFERMRNENKEPEEIVEEKKKPEIAPPVAPKMLEIKIEETPEPKKIELATENKKTVHYSTNKTELPANPGTEK